MTHKLGACKQHRTRSRDGFALTGSRAHYPPDLELEPTHLDIALAVDVGKRRVDGRVTTTVYARQSGPSRLTLDAVGFDIAQVVDPDGRPLSWRYDGTRLHLRWPEAFGRGEWRRVEVTYRVVEPVTGLIFSGPSEERPDAPRFAATDHETERARFWLPCLDLPNARPAIDWHLRADRAFTILAGGTLLGEEQHEDGTHTSHWRLEQPCPSYLTCFVVGDLVRLDDAEVDGVPIAYFSTRRHTEEHLKTSFGRTPEIMAWMTDKLGRPFPYPKYYQFAVPGIGGAMENISLTSWDDLYVVDDELGAEWGHLIDSVNVHEMAHSFFGDDVGCRDFAHAWLKESWATYMERCWLEDRRGRDEADYDLYLAAEAYFAEADGRYKRPLVTRKFASSWQMYDQHLYPGGACRLHTLRYELGDDTFWAATRAYLERFSGRVVETDDFRRVFEEFSGRSLVRFFEQWFQTPGYPSLEIKFDHDSERGEGSFEIVQTQVDDKAGVPAFAMKLELMWIGSDGRDHLHVVELEEARRTVTLAMPEPPEQVRVDPDAKVLHKLSFNPGDDLLQTQLTNARDIIGRILAARELCKTGRRKNIRAVARALETERFWGARIEMTRALAETPHESAVEAVLARVAAEHDPRVTGPVFAAAGKVRDARVLDALLARLDTPLGPRSLRMLLEALGGQGEEAPLAVLEAHAGEESFNDLAQVGAMTGLGRTRTEAALEVLLAHLADRATPYRARGAAALALGDLSPWMRRAARERIVDALVDQLRDPSLHVAIRAVRALARLGERRAVGALEALRPRLAQQDRVEIDQALRQIRAQGSSTEASLQSTVEKLEVRLRELTERVDKLEDRAERHGDKALLPAEDPDGDDEAADAPGEDYEELGADVGDASGPAVDGS